MNENLKITGSVRVKVTNAEGQVVIDQTQPNLVVTAGKVQLAALIAQAAVTAPTHMALGDNATVPVIADTTLVSEIGRVALTSTTPSSNTVVYIGDFGPGVATGVLQEAGLFNAGAGGTMTCRTLFALAVPKSAGDSLELTWTLTVG